MTESDWIDEQIKEFDNMRKLSGIRQIWTYHPMGVGRDIIDWFHQVLKSATSQGARDKNTAWCACGDALEEKPIWKDLKSKIYIHGKEVSRVIDHYEYYCFGCDKTYALVQLSPSKEVEEK